MNAARHARPKRISVTLSSTPLETRLRVVDDGRGLPLKPSRQERGAGLEIMRYRAHGIGGDLTVRRGRHSRGTVVCCVRRSAGASAN